MKSNLKLYGLNFVFMVLVYAFCICVENFDVRLATAKSTQYFVFLVFCLAALLSHSLAYTIVAKSRFGAYDFRIYAALFMFVIGYGPLLLFYFFQFINRVLLF